MQVAEASIDVEPPPPLTEPEALGTLTLPPTWPEAPLLFQLTLGTYPDGHCAIEPAGPAEATLPRSLPGGAEPAETDDSSVTFRTRILSPTVVRFFNMGERCSHKKR